MGEERDQLRKRPARRTDLNAVYLVGNRTLEADVPATGTDRDARDTGWDLPALGNNVPNRERVARQAEGDRRRRSGGKEDAIEPLQVQRRRVCRRREGQVQLWDLCTIHRAVVLEREADRHDRVMEPDISRGVRYEQKTTHIDLPWVKS